MKVPLHDLWWLVSRASGVTALLLITLAVSLGLAMAGRVLRHPARRRAALRVHEDVTLVALIAIAVHGLALLGDAWLKPGLSGIAVPFAGAYRPPFTGLGIIAGYLALLLGPSFHLRRRIGARRWRVLHRLTPLVWLLGAIHTLGAGSDAGTIWLRVLVLAPVPLLTHLLVVRLLGPGPRRAAANPGQATAARPPAATGTTAATAGTATTGTATATGATATNHGSRVPTPADVRL